MQLMTASRASRAVGKSDMRRSIVLTLFLAAASAVGVAGLNTARPAEASSTVQTSSIVAADQLGAHGIELRAPAAVADAALISADAARGTARGLVGAGKDPEETYRVLASKTYFGPKRTAWLFLFSGGSGPVSGGPPEGADSRTFTVEYTGVLIDDQTGKVIRWFKGGSFTTQ